MQLLWIFAFVLNTQHYLLLIDYILLPLFALEPLLEVTTQRKTKI